MPVRRVVKNGAVGYQWGNQKVCPTKAQAEAQGKAIYASGWVEKKKIERRCRG